MGMDMKSWNSSRNKLQKRAPALRVPVSDKEGVLRDPVVCHCHSLSHCVLGLARDSLGKNLTVILRFKQ